MKAAVLSIGTELTRGELVNSNAAWLSEQLTQLGFDVLEHATVPDEVPLIVAHLERLAGSYRILVCTGGLGPTSDDLTTEAVARAAGVPLELDRASLERVRGFFARFNRSMPAINEKQALLPRGADVLSNDEGTAPGFGLRLGECWLFCMPGVPREMEHIFESHLVPRLAPMAERCTYQRHLRTFGETESRLAELLEGVEAQFDGVTLGYRASFPEIEVKVLARSKDEALAAALAERATVAVRERIGPFVFGEGDITFAAAVGKTLVHAGCTLAVAESCTGGLVGQLLTSVPGSSEYLLMDAVVYSNAAKTRVLGVSEDLLRHHGAVSEEVAQALVRGALRVSGADLAVAITGIAGPGGGTDDKPVGAVWIAAAARGGREVVRYHRLPGDRRRIRMLAAYLALRMVETLAR